MNDNTLPAGLEDSHVEYYRVGDRCNAMYAGTRFPFHQLPAEAREPIGVELINDKKAFNCLAHDMKIEPSMMEEQLAWCRYGRFNTTPDFNTLTCKLTPDAPGCEKEKTCPGFGIVCKIPAGVNGNLTKQEYFIVRLVVAGHDDKGISRELAIELTTVRTHMQRIHYKLDVFNRIQIFIWAKSHGIE